MSQLQPPILQSELNFAAIYDNAKNYKNFEEVYAAVLAHPDLLTKIPDGRNWAIIHQVCFTGDTNQFNQLLALQINNPKFRLLSKTNDNKSVLDIAREASKDKPTTLFQRIERLKNLDELLRNAECGNWSFCKQLLQSQPDLANEKPPYHHFYFLHHLACMGERLVFDELSRLCHFDFTISVDNETASNLAAAGGFRDFVKAIDRLSQILPTTPRRDELSTGRNASSRDQKGSIDTERNPTPPSRRGDQVNSTQASLPYFHFDQITLERDQYNNHIIKSDILAFTSTSERSLDSTTSRDRASGARDNSRSTISDNNAYYKNICKNIQCISSENLLRLIICPITGQLLQNPVTATDGFVYERENISKWLLTNNRSPTTNMEIKDKDLKPNTVIEQIIAAIKWQSQVKHEDFQSTSSVIRSPNRK
ncbi:unnamed protein product [Didymodactylos carnosus]|nr:unnamed protein product [Didymodactylos carnosus]CAF3773240.1 unnamed protein product [Didymodactylos carnosus]